MPSTLNPDLNFPGLRESQSVASAREMVNLGAELRRELELVAREQGLDGTALARRLVREYLAGRNHNAGASSVR